MIDPQQIFQRAQGVETATFGAEEVVLDPKGRMLRGLNPTGARVWALLDGKKTVRELALVLVAELKVDEARALADVQAFLQLLLDRQLISQQP